MLRTPRTEHACAQWRIEVQVTCTKHDVSNNNQSVRLDPIIRNASRVNGDFENPPALSGAKF